jgi:predicted transcriptional regulator
MLIELDAETAAKLEKVAPARSRRRSEFVRAAIRRALWEVEERATREAYLRQPQLAEEPSLDPAAWDPLSKPSGRSRHRR